MNIGTRIAVQKYVPMELILISFMTILILLIHPSVAMETVSKGLWWSTAVHQICPQISRKQHASDTGTELYTGIWRCLKPAQDVIPPLLNIKILDLLISLANMFGVPGRVGVIAPNPAVDAALQTVKAKKQEREYVLATPQYSQRSAPSQAIHPSHGPVTSKTAAQLRTCSRVPVANVSKGAMFAMETSTVLDKRMKTEPTAPEPSGRVMLWGSGSTAHVNIKDGPAVNPLVIVASGLVQDLPFLMTMDGDAVGRSLKLLLMG